MEYLILMSRRDPRQVSVLQVGRKPEAGRVSAVSPQASCSQDSCFRCLRSYRRDAFREILFDWLLGLSFVII